MAWCPRRRETFYEMDPGLDRGYPILDPCLQSVCEVIEQPFFQFNAMRHVKKLQVEASHYTTQHQQTKK